jgi:arylsulfatase A-like enzyme
VWLAAALLAIGAAGFFVVRRLAEVTELTPRDATKHAGMTLGLLAGYLLVFALLGWTARRLPRARWRGLWVGVVGVSMVGHFVLLGQLGWERLGGRVSEPPGGRGLNVLLLTVDTLRADHLGAYGSAVRTPRIDRLASEGVLFERAIAQASWTRASYGSLLTSLYPSQHGAYITNQAVEAGKPFRQVFSGALRTEPVTLTERLRDRGYRTVAIQSNWQASGAQGFDRGFDVFVHAALFTTSFWARSSLGFYLAEVGTILTSGRRWVPFWAAFPQAPRIFDVYQRFHREGIGEPWFLWVNLMDPHSPYRLWDESEPPESRQPIEVLDDRDPEVPIAALEKAYDSEVRFADHFVGRMLDLLEETGLADHTLVVFAADHGEEFGDHGVELPLARVVTGRHHGHSLFNELLHVPLILRLPGVLPAGRRVAATARLIDVAPTVLELVGAPEPDSSWEGKSLLPLIDGTEGSSPGWIAFSERVLYGLEQKAAQSDRWKWIAHLDQGRLELYDLAADPGEVENRIEDGLEGPEELLAAFSEWMERMPGDEIGEPLAEENLSAEERKRLRALGYLQ